MPIFLVGGAPEAIRADEGRSILVTNLLTEGRGMAASPPATPSARSSEAIGRPIDVVIVNTSRPLRGMLARYAQEHKEPLELGDVPGCVRGRARRVLVRRNRAPRSPAARLRGLGRAGAAVVVAHATRQ